MNSTPIEIERKFLIAFPSLDKLKAQKGSKIKMITQTYLPCEKGNSSRIRKITQNGSVSYVKTLKKRISPLSCFEEESEITKAEYEELLQLADKSKVSINKTRYAFEYHKHIMEIDVYEFWQDRAILEIELSREDEEFSIPKFIELIKEVSQDKRYKNTNLAKSVPYDKI